MSSLNRENLHIRVFGMRRTMICLACSNALHSDHRSRSKLATKSLKPDLKIRLIETYLYFVIDFLETMFDDLFFRESKFLKIFDTITHSLGKLYQHFYPSRQL